MPSERPSKEEALMMFDAMKRLDGVFMSLAMLLYISKFAEDAIDAEAQTEQMLETIQVDDATDPAMKAQALRLYQEAVNMTVDRLAPRFLEVAEAQEKGETDGSVSRYGW